MKDLTPTRNAYDNQEIDDMGWIKSGENIVDAFKKLGRNDGLERMLDTGLVSQSVAKWVVRDGPTRKQKTEERKPSTKKQC